ncbi:CoA-binding protein [Tenacibaculum xiamenense]|uniref:CoA-binding protein n=1 Tax=Tenacibaculum xiamenense TaxID=1261553 RepID=UPI0038965A5F
MKNTTLVLGASLNESRYSNRAIKSLVENKVNTLAIGASKGEVSGVQISDEKELFKNIDTVTLYINPKIQEDYYDYILNLKPRRVIFNPGTENIEFINILRSNNILVEEACTLVLLSINQYN